MNCLRMLTRVLPCAALLFVFSGCRKQPPPPPTGRAELVARFFQSIENNDINAAMRQGVKLRSLDSHNENIIRLVEIQQCNAYISSAQQLVNAGKIREAISVLQKGVRQYPDNVTLRQLLPRVRQLRNARNLLRGMKRASNSISMRSALTAARIGLSVNTTPALEKYFAAYEKKILETEKKEKAAAAIKAAAAQAKSVTKEKEPQLPAGKKK
ncbi:MAG: hypothetical protein IKC65_06465 [Lentisphaeria bacterium]|nr:hypothetical protein [Lentisphaeria bacterium]